VDTHGPSIASASRSKITQMAASTTTIPIIRLTAPVVHVSAPQVHVAAPSDNTALLAALIGVLVGGVISLAVGQILDVWRTKNRLRAAGQLIGVDLVTKLGATVLLEAAQHWMPPEKIPKFTERDVWRESRAVLSYHGHEAWLTAARVYLELDGIEQLALRRSGQPIQSDERQRIKGVSTTITEAIALLDALTSPPPAYKVRSRLRYAKGQRETRRKVRESRQ